MGSEKRVRAGVVSCSGMLRDRSEDDVRLRLCHDVGGADGRLPF
jgi:hypothetical protein